MSPPLPVAEPELPRGPRFLVALGTLAAVGFSLVLLSWELAMEPALRGKFLYENALGIPLRNQLLLTLLAGVVVPASVAAIIRLKKGPRVVPALYRFAAICSPLGLAFAAPMLFEWQGAQKSPLFYLVMLGVFALAARALFAWSFEEWRKKRLAKPGPVNRLPLRFPSFMGLGLVLLAAAGYAIYASYFSILNHRQLGTSAFDLGVYDNLMYNAMHGRFFHSPVLFGPGSRSYLAGHAELSMLLFVPFYALWPKAEMLLVLQSLLLGLSAIPLYLFAARLVSKAGAVLLAVAYLLFAPLHGAQFSGFHWLPIAIFFHFWLYYAILTERRWLTVACVVVLLGIREDVAVGLALLGLLLFLSGTRNRVGLGIFAAASAWFVFDRFVLMPRMGAWWFEHWHNEVYANKRASVDSAVATLLSNPTYSLSSLVRETKLEYGLHMLAPLGFLPLKRAAFVLLIVPGAAVTLIANAYWPTAVSAFQYTAHFIPYLFLGTVLALAVLRFEPAAASRRKAALAVVGIAVVSHSYNFGAVLQRESYKSGGVNVAFEPSRDAAQRYRELTSLIERIPREASVAAPESLNPHISARLDAYTFRYDFGPVDYLLLTSREASNEARSVLVAQLSKVPYRLIKRAGDFYLFKRGPGNAATDAAYRELGMPVGVR